MIDNDCICIPLPDGTKLGCPACSPEEYDIEIKGEGTRTPSKIYRLKDEYKKI